MKPKSKRAFGTALFGTILLSCNLVLAACGADSPTPVSNNVTTTAATTTATTTTATTTAATTTVATTSATTTTAAITTTAPATATSSFDLPKASLPPVTVAPTTAPATATIAPQPSPTTLPSVDRFTANFATYQEDKVTVKPAVPAYSVNADLGNITNIKDFTLTDAEKKLIAQNDFVIQPAQYKQFFQAYESYRYDQVPTFVTTDSVLHIYHLIFDKILRETERTYLTKDLTQLNVALYTYALQQYNQLKGGPLDEAVKRELGIIAVARKLNNPSDNFSIPSDIASSVQSELTLISQHQGEAQSVIMGSDYHEDYSQYVPRGHYSLSPDLEQYFRAMMWYGRMTFRLKSPSETQTALLLAQAITNGSVNNRKASDYWDLIYEPTSFLVGNSDDLTYIDYMNVAKAVYGPTATTDSSLFGDSGKLNTFIEATKALPPPKINSLYIDVNQGVADQTQGMRVMGQRFTIDEYVFDQLVWRNVGTNDNQRLLPKALDVFAALGSSQAYTNLTAEKQDQYTNYASQMTKLKNELANTSTATWTQNVYWAWIYNFQPLTQKYGAGYPSFMQTAAWQNKMLLTGLGSYTELKHDTILYAKQILAERGGGPDELPTGYVEAIPEFYARVNALAKMTKAGLQQRNLLSQSVSDLLDSLVKDSSSLESIAVKEVDNQAVSDSDVSFMAYWGAEMEGLTHRAADIDSSQGNGTINMDNQDEAVVADIATDPNGNVLEEGTGHPSIIYVAVPIKGKVVLSEGVVYSQYEFVNSANKRLTDEEWRQQVSGNTTPALEPWKQAIIAAGPPQAPSQP